MSRGATYRRKADELHAMASAAETESLRLGLLAMVAQYKALAAQADGSEAAAAERVEGRDPSSAHRHGGVVVIGLLSDELG